MDGGLDARRNGGTRRSPSPPRAEAHWARGPALVTFEVDQSSVGRLETAGAEVEPTQVVLEVDMEPLTTGRLGPLCGHGYKFGAHVATLVRACDDRVQDESMAGPVPRHVQEADQLPVVSRADPPEAVALKLRLPVGPGKRVVLEALTVQRLDLSVGEASPPFVEDGHLARMPGRERVGQRGLGRPTTR
jgi:hypothetical protein